MGRSRPRSLATRALGRVRSRRALLHIQLLQLLLKATALKLVLDLGQPRCDLITPLFIQEGLSVLSPAVEAEVVQGGIEVRLVLAHHVLVQELLQGYCCVDLLPLLVPVLDELSILAPDVVQDLVAYLVLFLGQPLRGRRLLSQGGAAWSRGRPLSDLLLVRAHTLPPPLLLQQLSLLLRGEHVMLQRCWEYFVVQDVLACQLGLFDCLGEVCVRLLTRWDDHRLVAFLVVDGASVQQFLLI